MFFEILVFNESFEHYVLSEIVLQILDRIASCFCFAYKYCHQSLVFHAALAFAATLTSTLIQIVTDKFVRTFVFAASKNVLDVFLVAFPRLTLHFRVVRVVLSFSAAEIVGQFRDCIAGCFGFTTNIMTRGSCV